MADRVDKSWQTKGLGAFSTEAILGTLAHYGGSVNEAQFKAQSQENFPIGIAVLWHKDWKGVGQFAKFPIAAADELWRRLEKERLLPSDFAVSLAQLVGALESMRMGAADAPVGERFKAYEALKGKVPLEKGKPNHQFVSEVVTHLGEEFLRAFNQLSEALAKDGHVDDAEALASVEEFLFPERAGTSKAVVKAARGDKEGALADLEKLAANTALEAPTRLSAVDALIHLGALDSAKSHGTDLLAIAEKDDDFHFGLDVGERLFYLFDKKPAATDKPIRDRVMKMVEAHRKAHPHHH